MFGGGKGQQEIIDELKNKGKYEEWVRLGSRYGLRIDNSKTIPLLFYDVDGNMVQVDSIQDTYKPDVENIAVFKKYISPTEAQQQQQRAQQRASSQWALQQQARQQAQLRASLRQASRQAQLRLSVYDELHSQSNIQRTPTPYAKINPVTQKRVRY